MSMIRYYIFNVMVDTKCSVYKLEIFVLSLIKVIWFGVLFKTFKSEEKKPHNLDSVLRRSS